MVKQAASARIAEVGFAPTVVVGSSQIARDGGVLTAGDSSFRTVAGFAFLIIMADVSHDWKVYTAHGVLYTTACYYDAPRFCS